MMYGYRDKFLYFKCSFCGCLQIADPPQNITKYYPTDRYYSYQNNDSNSKVKSALKRLLIYGYLNNLISSNSRYIQGFSWLFLLRKIKKSASILDIGCGTGHLLKEMAIWGFNNLTGLDPFIKENIIYPSGVQIYKKNIFEHTGQYDLLMMHHSFEHMDNPLEVLQQCYQLLTFNGQLLVRIPVVDCFAYRKYGVNWYQIDAPRHFFLHTIQSISLLAQKTGFIISKIKYDSTINQFLCSEQYCQNIPLSENIESIPKRVKVLRQQANKLNLCHDGDQAIFILKKQPI